MWPQNPSRWLLHTTANGCCSEVILHSVHHWVRARQETAQAYTKVTHEHARMRARAHTHTHTQMFRHFTIDDRFNSSGPIVKCYLKETVYEDEEWIRWSPVRGSVNQNDFRCLINQN